MKSSFGPITSTNIGMLRVLNCKIFPVNYSDKFYNDILETPPGLSMYAYVDGMAVGAICCRVESIENNKKQRVYIMTLGVLEAYRNQLLVGTALVRNVLEYCQDLHMDHIYLHVHTTNIAAIRFYRRFGFMITETIHNYYRNISPPDCYILARSFYY
ncbi:acetyltransferase, GNAT family protein [Thraustotheca clavata]|uniref:Acetyltransferase, GNAT family protein n=1 Tax=Thraustotheca clavata TaxID=74557 RepID=A0A1W0A2P4_9STRA|nr:acetyltransferase, GNAT family protein [Thraustotheca clavata]